MFLFVFPFKEYEAKVIVTSKLKYFSLIKEKLNDNRRKLFRSTCFGGWLDIFFFEPEPHMLDYILKTQGYVDKAQYDMPLIYNVDGRSLHFGRPEFALITGFRFGNVNFDLYRSGEVKLKSRLFPKKIEVKLTNLDLLGVIEDEELFGKISDEDAIRVCLLFVYEVIFLGRLLVEDISDVLVRLVDDLDGWNSFPWGEHIWQHLYRQLLNVVSNHRWEHLKGLKNDRKYVPTYTIKGFVWAFKVSPTSIRSFLNF